MRSLIFHLMMPVKKMFTSSDWKYTIMHKLAIQALHCFNHYENNFFHNTNTKDDGNCIVLPNDYYFFLVSGHPLLLIVVLPLDYLS